MLLLPARSAQAQERPAAADQPPSIETIGTGERRVAPDRASVHVLVESRAPRAAAAASANARAVQVVRDSLRQSGLDSAVTTASYSVGIHYEPPRSTDRVGPQQHGFAARTVLRIRLTRIDQVGRAIDASLAGGASAVQDVAFETSLQQATQKEALALAAVAAREEAEVLARALGGTLGPLISTSSTGGWGGVPRLPVRMDVPAPPGYATQIAPSDIVVNAVVLTRWRFVPGR